MKLDGTASKIHIGKNQLALITKNVAQSLGMPDWDLYTSHCSRRSMASLLAENNHSEVAIMGAGHWKSSTSARKYIEQSVASKMTIANTFTSGNHSASNSSSSSSSKSLVIDNPKNQTTNIYNFDMKNAKNCNVSFQVQDGKIETSLKRTFNEISSCENEELI